MNILQRLRWFLGRILPIRLNILRRSIYHPNDRFGNLPIRSLFNIKPGDKVLDIGSGGYPFPEATHLADLYVHETTHRMESLVKDDRPFTVCDIHALPFEDQAFDFVICSHLLEHVNDPARACEELMRVGRRGYIETPTKTSDIMFNYLGMKDHHTWQVTMLHNTLIFMEWLPEERKDTGTKYFKQQLFSRWANPFQTLVMTNQHLFNNMMLWEEKFYYYVFNKDGELIATNRR